MSESIAKIKEEYKKTSEFGILEYNDELEALFSFIDRYNDDERSGVQSIISSAEKRINKINKEISRVQEMMQFENKYAAEFHYICGVDEVGRGPLAGPIVTAAVIFPEGMIIPYVNDSKQINEAKREELYDIITKNAVSYSIGIKSEKEIDDIGIAKADSLAMKEAVLGLDVKSDLVLVDAFKIPELDIKQVPIIKGDTKSVSIAAASIVAKVTRDRMMVEYSKKYPEYGFDSNKGYGSAMHIEALKNIGPCEIHRRSFIGNFVEV